MDLSALLAYVQAFNFRCNLNCYTKEVSECEGVTLLTLFEGKSIYTYSEIASQSLIDIRCVLHLCSVAAAELILFNSSQRACLH